MTSENALRYWVVNNTDKRLSANVGIICSTVSDDNELGEEERNEEVSVDQDDDNDNNRPNSRSTNRTEVSENRTKISFEEHLVNDYPIPELLMSNIKKITNLEGYNYAKGKDKTSTDANLSLWTNTNYGYYEDGDILTINFTRKANVFHSYCENIDSLLICYVPNNKIISVEIFQASAVLDCHFFDYNEIIDNKPPLCLYSIYCEDRDELNVYFTDDPSTKRLQSIEVDEDILLQISNDGKLNALLFRNANNRIAKEFSKEDRESLIRSDELIYKLRRLLLDSPKLNEKKWCIIL